MYSVLYIWRNGMKIGGLLKRAYILYGLSVNEKLKKYDMTMSQLDVLIKVTRANEKEILIHQRDIEKSPIFLIQLLLV